MTIFKVEDSTNGEKMGRDIWLDDEEPGCLECGALVFRASYLDGVCVDCMNEVSSASFSSRDHDIDFFEYGSNGEDTPWIQTAD